MSIQRLLTLPGYAFSETARLVWLALSVVAGRRAWCALRRYPHPFLVS